MQFGLKQSTIDLLKGVFIQYADIEEVLIYGSRAKGNFRDSSDIDLSIKGEISLKKMLQLETQLDDLLLPYEIDLSLYRNLGNQDLIAHIDRIGITFFKK